VNIKPAQHDPRADSASAGGAGFVMPYLPRLDTFRAVAAVLVVYAHYFDYMSPWRNTTGYGTLGVSFFFMLSGFLITGILLVDDGADKFQRLKRFYIRRSFRIFPVYYCMLVIGVALGILGFRESLPWTALYLSNFYMDFGGTDTAYAGHFWSLAVEEQFYLLWPMALIFLPRRHLIAATSILIVAILSWPMLSAVLGLPSLAPYRFLTILHLPPLCLGALMAIVYCQGGIERIERLLRCLLPITVPSLALYVIWLRVAVSEWVPIWILFPIGPYLLFAWLIARAVRDGPTANSWGGRILPAFGMLSYGIYVYHLPIRAIVDRFDPYWISWFIRAAGVVATVLVAWLSYHYLEAPARAFGRRLAGKQKVAYQPA
jgi:peptidoglycan/LPS O-acetylase OafA/YrhL